MRAVTFVKPWAGPDFTSIHETDVPHALARQLSIDVEFAGVNYIDVMSRRGDPGYAPSWPFIPGLEVAGTVRDVGAEVTAYAPGDRVAAFTRGGGLAEVAVAEEALTAHIPDAVTGAAAAAAPLMLSTALLLLTDVTRFQPGETVLMHAAGGGVGGAVAQVVAALGGGNLVGTVSSREKIEAARESGWTHVLVRDDSLEAQLHEAGIREADIVLDPLGTRMLDFDVAHTAPGGRIVIFGNPAGDALEQLPPLGQLIGRNISIGGFSMSRLTADSPARAARALERALTLLAAQTLRAPVSIIGSLEGVPEAHDSLASGKSVGKQVVHVTG